MISNFLLIFMIFALRSIVIGFLTTLGGSGVEYGNSFQQTTDGGYITTGLTYSFGAGNSDILIAKFYSNGTLTWAFAVGGSSPDSGYSVQQTNDGGFIVAGISSSSSSEFPSQFSFLAKFTHNGSFSWAKQLGGSNSDRGLSVIQTNDGGYLLVGNTDSVGAGMCDILLAKFDTTGTLLWQKTLGGSNDDYAWSVKQTDDTGYIIVGNTHSFGSVSHNLLLMKTTSDGNLLWAITFGGLNNEMGKSVQQTSDGGYIVTGHTKSFGKGYYDIFLAKITNEGNLSWAKTFGGTGDDHGYSVHQTTDGGYILTGDTTSFGAGSVDILLAKFYFNGTLSWVKTIGGTGFDFGKMILQVNDGTFVLVGYSVSFGEGNYAAMLLAKIGFNEENCMLQYIQNITTTATLINPTVRSISPTVSSATLTIHPWDPSVYKISATENIVCGCLYILKWREIPKDQTVEFGNRFQYKVTASSECGTDLQQVFYSVSDTTNFAIDVSGALTNKTTLRAGIYSIQLIASDGTNMNEVVIKIIVNPPTPLILFTKTYGGTNYDVGYSLQQTIDGGFVVTGTTKSYGFGNNDIFLSKFLNTGDLSWFKILGGGNDDLGRSVQQTSDGGFIVAGYTFSFGAGDYDVFLAKFRCNGEMSWAKTFGGSENDGGLSVQMTNDNGYIVVGYSQSFGPGHYNIFLTKFTNDGNFSWAKTLGGSGNDDCRAFSVQLTDDGGFVITGHFQSYNLLLAKFTKNGTLNWAKVLGRSYDNYNIQSWGTSVQQTLDGGYIVVGLTISDIYGVINGGILLAKFTSFGDLSWAKSFGGSSGYDEGKSVQQTTDGGFIVSGSTTVSGNTNLLIAKFSNEGTLEWAKTLGGINTDRGYFVKQTMDEGFIATGSTKSFGAGNYDILLVKFGSGNEGCNYTKHINLDPNFNVISISPSVNSISYITQTESPTVKSWNPAITSVLPKKTVVCEHSFLLEWENQLTNQFVEFGYQLRYDMTISDDIAVLYSLNDSHYFSINATGILTNAVALPIGKYFLQVNITYDGTYEKSAVLKIYVQDTIVPIWNEVPTDQIIEYCQPFSYVVKASDLRTVIYTINFTTSFAIDSNGVLTNNTVLAIGNYVLQLNASDGINVNSTVITIIVETIAPIWNEIPTYQIILISTAIAVSVVFVCITGIFFTVFLYYGNKKRNWIKKNLKKNDTSEKKELEESGKKLYTLVNSISIKKERSEKKRNYRINDSVKCYMSQNQLFNFFTIQKKNKKGKNSKFFKEDANYPPKQEEEEKNVISKTLLGLTGLYKEFVEDSSLIPEPENEYLTASINNEEDESISKDRIKEQLRRTYHRTITSGKIDLGKECVGKHLPPRDVIESYRNLNYKKIDQISIELAEKIQNVKIINFKDIVSEICKNVDKIVDSSKGEIFVVRGIYRFLCELLEYKNQKDSKFTTYIVESKQAMCEGFSDIFVKLCDEAKIFGFKIHGKSKDLQGVVHEKIGHCWNGVFIRDYFFPFDATWSWGTKSKLFDDHWWLSYPCDFIMTHYPDLEHPQLQFLKEPISERQWRGLVYIPIGWQRQGLGVLTHIEEEVVFHNKNDCAIIEIRNEKEIQLAMELFSESTIVNGVQRKARNLVRENERCLLYQNSIEEKKTIIHMTFPRKNQKYLLKINGKNPSQKYSYIFKYEITNFSICRPLFPQITEYHRNKNCFLYSPMEGTLIKGKVYKVKIGVPGAIDVVLNEGLYIKLTTPLYKRNSDDIFYGKIEFHKMKTDCGIIVIFAHYKQMKENEWMPLVIFGIREVQ